MKNVHRIKSRDSYKKCQIDYRNKKEKLTDSQYKLMKVVYKDRDWDYCYIYDLLSAKLKNVLEYSETTTITTTKAWRPQWIKRAIALIDILKGTEDFLHDVYVNLNNYKRFGMEAKVFYNSIQQYEKEIEETGGIRYGTINGKKTPVFLEEMIKFNKEEIYQIKARHLLFKILNQYIVYWWD